MPAGAILEEGDALVSLHRDLGAILAYYLDLERAFPGFSFEELPASRKRPGHKEPQELLFRLFCQLLGKHEGFSAGIERSFHYGYFDPSEIEPGKGLVHAGMISHLGSMIPVAAGCGFALQRAGTDRIAINFIGDGGTSTGDFHEGLNLAAVWNLPLILIIENNHYAFSTPTADQYKARRLSDRAIGYGIVGEHVDGTDPEAMAVVLERAVARARSGGGPTLIEAVVGRMRGHAEGDDSLKVVPPEDLERYVAQDPVPRYGERLIRDGLFTEEQRALLDARASELVEEALERALDAEPAKKETARRPALCAVPGESENLTAPALPEPSASEGAPQPTSYVDSVSRALEEALEQDERVVVMGQDVATFEGAFRVTRGFAKRWPERIRDTPIAESGTLGLAAGAALLGMRPVVEMQFADFVSCGFNQIANVIAKMYYRYEKPCPLVVRLPSGGGVGAGAFSLAKPRGLVCAHRGAQGGLPRQRLRRLESAACVDRGSQSGDLL